MDKRHFGELVRALRSEHLDENLHGWTREKYSEEISKTSGRRLTSETIGKIERGERQNISSEELAALADGLQLTSVERQGFFEAALGFGGQEMHPQQVPPTQLLTNLLANLQGVRQPFFIVDSYADAIAMNNMLIRFLMIPLEVVAQLREHPLGFNIIRIIFDPIMGYRDLVGKDIWEDIAIHNILLFRGNSILHRATPYFKYVMSNLRKIGSFRWRWEEIYWQQHDYTGAGFQYCFKHPEWGNVNYVAIESRIVTSEGTLILVVYTPLDVNTAQVFENLAQVPDLLEHQKLASWPEKIIT